MYTIHICSKCKEECSIVYEIDLEPYEFWGQKGVHRAEIELSACCKKEIETRDILEEGDKDFSVDDERMKHNKKYIYRHRGAE